MRIPFAASVPNRLVERREGAGVGENVALLERPVLQCERGRDGFAGAHDGNADAQRFGVDGLQERAGAELYDVVGWDCGAGVGVGAAERVNGGSELGAYTRLEGWVAEDLEDHPG